MNRKKLSGFQKRVLQLLTWPILLNVILVVLTACICLIDVKAGICATIVSVIYVFVLTLLYWRKRDVVEREVVDFAMSYGQVQKQILKELHVPYALLDTKGDIVWKNNRFMETIAAEKATHHNIGTIFERLTFDWVHKVDDYSTTIEYGQMFYRIEMHKMKIDSLKSNEDLGLTSDIPDTLIGMYVYDDTELRKFMKEVEEQRAVMGMIYIDNYDEALESVEDVRRSLLLALIDRRINKHFAAYDGVVRKIEADKYFVILKDKEFRAMKEAKFPIIKEIKTVNIGNEMSVTLSIGFGIEGKTYGENCSYARAAIDLALGRGGDQVVMKYADHNEYFGSSTKQVDRNTRVKARVKAQALREIMEANEKIFIMGHSIPDVDCFGAAVGVHRAAKAINRRAYIVLDEITITVRQLVEQFRIQKDFDTEMFISSERALELVDSSSAVVVVDVNKPSLCECAELLTKTKNVVVFDHHRQGDEVIKNAVLAYIEPYASSTCEMVAEMLQYFDENIRLKNIEADSIYAGIMIDTNNFVTKTGVRTFEAAAYLRRCGADVSRVRRLFREDMKTNKARAAMIMDTEVYNERFAITVCPGESLESPTVVGAQVANELLNIVGIKATFVLTPYRDLIYISARSIEDINVQRVMERLGGGGHLTMAGAQLASCTVEDAKQKIRETIDAMEAEGEL